MSAKKTTPTCDSVKTTLSKENAPAVEATVEQRPAYRPPQAYVLGKAVDLMRQDIDGQLIDGTDGWYVWGSR